MKKFTAIAAMLAMVLVAAAPAAAQTVEGDVIEGDRQFVGEDATFQSASNVQYSVNILDGDNTTDTNNFIGGDTGDENAIGGGNIDQSLSNESSQDVQNAFADDDSLAVTDSGEFFFFWWWF